MSCLACDAEPLGYLREGPVGSQGALNSRVLDLIGKPAEGSYRRERIGWIFGECGRRGSHTVNLSWQQSPCQPRLANAIMAGPLVACQMRGSVKRGRALGRTRMRVTRADAESRRAIRARSRNLAVALV